MEPLTLSLSVAGGLLAAGIFLQRRTSKRLRRTNAVLGAAQHEAGWRGHGHVTLEHVLLALSFDEDIEAHLSALGVDTERLREGLAEELTHVAPSEDRTKLPGLDSRVEYIIRLASTRRLHPTPRSLFDAIADGPQSRARTLLAQTGAPRSDANLASLDMADGPYRSAPTPGDTAVRFWNDSKTSVAFVIGALVEHVGLEPARACYLAYRIHYDGSFEVTVRPRNESERIATRVTEAARASGFPLRVTTEKVT